MIAEGVLLARFLAYYPGAYHSPAWPTRDGVIPWRLFYILSSELQAIHALERLIALDGTGSAIGLAFGDAKGRDPVRALVREAFPTVRR